MFLILGCHKLSVVSSTVNVDIFACIQFCKRVLTLAIWRGFVFAFLMLLPLCGIIIIIFTMFIFLLIFEKHELPENMYSAKSSTLTVIAHETSDTACRYYEFLSCY